MRPHERLEESFATVLKEWGAPGWEVVACSSGTAALHLALESLCLPQGSEVLVPSYTMIAVPRAVVLAGLVPVFVDVLNDLTLDPEDLLRKNGPGVEAVVPVSTYGRPCQGACYVLSNFLWIIEDLAEAHGQAPRGDIACWSFYSNKTLCGEEGGALAVSPRWKDSRSGNPRHMSTRELVRSLRCLGFTEEHDYQHVPRGHNYRMSDSHSRAVNFSLDRRAELFQQRVENVARLDAECPEEWRMPYRQYPWVYDLRIPGMDRQTQNRLVETMRREGVGIRHGFYPLHLQDEFLGAKSVCPNAEKLYPEIVYVPLSTTTAQMNRVIHMARELAG